MRDPVTSGAPEQMISAKDSMHIQSSPSKEKLQAELEDAKLLHKLSIQLIQEEGTAGLYKKIVEAAIAIMRSQYASMQILVPDSGNIGKLHLLASSGFTPAAEKFWEWVYLTTGSSCGAALRAQKRVVISNFRTCEFMQDAPTLPIFLEAGILAAQSTPLYSRGGKLLGMISTHWSCPHNPPEYKLELLDILARQAADLIERTQTAEALKNSEERLSALTIATNDVVYRMSPDWKEMYQLDGRNFLSHTGEPIDNWMQKYLLPEDQPYIQSVIQQAIQTKTVFQLEHRVLSADGTVGWTFSRAIPVVNSEREITEWFGAASDITARKRMEEELNTAKDKTEIQKRLYETITGSTPDLVYVFDLNYRFTYANKALLTMWGMNWDEAIGKTLIENGYEPWHAEMHEREIDEVIATKKPIRGEVSFPHAILGKRIYDYIFAPVINEKGEVEAIAGTTRDITEIKAAEETLKRSRTELEELVKERTIELQRSNDDLQQFAHVASHDMKEPVRKISLFANRIKEYHKNDLPEKTLSYLNGIEKSSRRLSDMISGVLEYSTIENREVMKEKIDVNEVLKNVQSDLEIVIQNKEAKIKYEKLPIINASPVLINQLFYNLLNNSLKFSKKGIAPIITIKQEALSENDLTNAQSPTEKTFIKIVIEDNGIGFDQNLAKDIFKTFLRLHSKDMYEGSGLGLAFCKKIMERHDGAIYAEGKTNKGARFILLFPE